MQPSELAKPALSLFLAFFLCRGVGAVNEQTHAGTHRGFDFLHCACRGGRRFGNRGGSCGDDRGGDFCRRRRVSLSGGLRVSRHVLGFGFMVMKPYRLARAIDFVDKDHKMLASIDPSGRILEYAHKTASTSDPGYQQRQAKIAVGSGGFVGVGLMQSKQKDAVSSRGANGFHIRHGGRGDRISRVRVLLLAGFLSCLWRGSATYFTRADNFGRYLALSVTCAWWCRR